MLNQDVIRSCRTRRARVRIPVKRRPLATKLDELDRYLIPQAIIVAVAIALIALVLFSTRPNLTELAASPPTRVNSESVAPSR